MKMLLRGLLLVPLILMSTGCPLSLTEPIDQPNVKVDDSWLGTYRGTVPSDYMIDASLDQWVLSKNSTYEYKITGKQGKGSKRPEDMEKDKRMGISSNIDVSYIAHVSMIKNQPFLNVNNSYGSYAFFEIESTDKGFLLKEISPNLGTYVTTADELRTTILNDLYKDELYGTSFTMER